MGLKEKIDAPLALAYQAFKKSLKQSRAAKLRYSTGIKLFQKLAAEEVICLDLGSGSSLRPEHVGIDLSNKADISWDILWGLPLPDNAVEGIRSDHFFEHLELEDAFYVLQECYRVLKPTGILDFTIPHLDPYLNAYSNGDISFLSEKISDVPEDKAHLYQTPWDYISWLLLREGEHRAIYDRASIIHKVKKAGFADVIVREYDSQRDMNYRFSSIYIKATK
jgi:predicted SAM-dependent methyltransferase